MALANNNNTMQLKSPESEDEWHSYHTIREKVLWEARGQFGVYDSNHADEYAPNHHPKLFMMDGTPVGVMRIDLDSDTCAACFRRVAVIESRQRLGLGSKMMELGEEFVTEHGIYDMIANVSPDAMEFYSKIGYSLDPSHPDNDPNNPRMIKTKNLV